MDEDALRDLVGKPLSEAVVRLGLDEKGFDYTDEPPGKLRAVTSGDLHIHLRYDSAYMFSDRRDWPLSRVGPAEVIGFSWGPGDAKRTVGTVHRFP